jgi:hypothetical protein
VGGHLLFAVKANQPELAADVALLFDRPPPGEVFAVARSHGRHGSRHAEHTLWASSALTAYLAEAGWPQVQQVLRGERRVMERGVSTREVRHFVTRRDARWSATDLLHLVRGHWHIENAVHDVRDVTLGEDASTVRTGVAPACWRRCATPCSACCIGAAGATSPLPCATTPGTRRPTCSPCSAFTYPDN